MTSMNKVFLAGNLTQDPDLRQTSTGRAVGNMNLAVTESYRNKDGQQVDSTCYADIVIWGKTAENCHQYLAKGSAVLVEGRLELNSWETAQGEKRNQLRVRADRVQFLSPQRNGKSAPAPAASPDNNRNDVKKPMARSPRETEEEQEPINF